ncbi:MAG: right-handed parallel beta-helix repeat-containing protein [Gemmatimonadales bacterium]|nr:right-handed parallel beta-helix repeat-containing protein [Gemmatimonadales bacterium]
MKLIVTAALFATGSTGALHDAPPCVRPGRGGVEVQGDVRICPGRYIVRDPIERGVIVVISSNTRVDLSGVSLESGDTLASAFVGAGVTSQGLNNVSIIGGAISGYRYGVRINGGRGHRVRDIGLSGSRAQRLHSTPHVFNEADWLDIFRPDTFEQYGGGVYLKNTEDATVTGVTAHGAQNGIVLFNVRRAYIADNDVSGNSGWGISLWRSAHNTIARNQAHHSVRCEGETYHQGCDSAALLMRQESDSNTIIENDLSGSGDGFFLSGHRPLLQPSVGNLVLRNDATGAFHNAFESTFSWGNSFIENHADSSGYGFWLGYSSGNLVRGNTILGSRNTGIAIEHGSDNVLSGNVIIGGRTGIWLFAPGDSGEPSRGYHLDDNVLARLDRGVVLERTTQARLRGNLFDGVQDGLVVDGAGRGSEVLGNVFLRAARSYIQAPELTAGGNYWGAADAEATMTKVKGKVTIQPWRPASAAGY